MKSVRTLSIILAIVGSQICTFYEAKAQNLSGREKIEAIEFSPLEFVQPSPEYYEVSGTQVLLLEDRSLPLITVAAQFQGGYGRFARDTYASAMGLPAMMRYGGTRTLTPDSLDLLLDYYAIQTSFGTGGGSISSSMNSLTEQFPIALNLWGEMLTEPRFDRDQIDIWRGLQLERLLRRKDNPSTFAFSQFNRLLYADHPIGWEMDESDLATSLIEPGRFREIHRHIICRDNMILGITGDLSWSDSEAVIQDLVDRVPPCADSLPDSPIPNIRREPGIFVIERELEQAVIVMAHPSAVKLADDPTYFAATMGNSILGSGGFTSRLLGHLRIEEGLAYSASSIWTTPRRYDGLVGALTSTTPENAIPAIELMTETMHELREAPPTDRELGTAVDRVVNGFVFNFQTPTRVVSRIMSYLAQDLPEDWLERYSRGIQKITPEQVHKVFTDHLYPEEMTILIVGDLGRIGLAALERLGPVTVLVPD